MEQQKEYYAFISYKREDEKWAKWLQDKLEYYKFPTNLNGRTDLPKNIRPTFRDVTDLKPGVLAEEINNALRNSEWLIVVCSPRSAKSPWVCKEAQAFIDLGRADHIIPFVIEGNPFSNDIVTECYPEALLNLTGNKELLAANINEMGRDAAAIKVVARMFNLRFDSLWQRYEREQKRKRLMTTGSALLIAFVSIGIGWYIYKKNIELDKINNSLEKAYKEIVLERDRADGERERAQRANDTLQMAYDSINWQNNYIIRQKSDLQIANYGYKTNLSRVLAGQSNQITDVYDNYIARLVALDALPPNLPYTTEAERALRLACQRDNSFFRGHTMGVNYAAFSPNGSFIVSASVDKTIRMWDTFTGKELKKMIGHIGAVNSASFSPDGKKIVSTGDTTIRIWNSIQGNEIKRLKGNNSIFTFAIFSPDGKKIASASFTGIISIWDAITGNELKKLKGHTRTVYSVSFSPDGKHIVSSSFDQTVRIWDIQTGKVIVKDSLTSIPQYAVFSPNGKRVAVALSDKTIKVIDAKWGNECMKLEGHTSSVTYVNYSHDGKRIVSTSADNTIRIWDAFNGGELIKFNGGGRTVVFSQDGGRIVSTSGGKSFRLWDVHMREKNMLEGFYFFNQNLTFSTDGKLVCAPDVYNNIKVWDVITGKKLIDLKGHTKPILFANFSYDGKRIVSTALDSTIRIWDVQTGKEYNKTIYKTNWISNVSISPNGKLIASVSLDGTVRIWDAITGKELKKLMDHTMAAFSPDGKFFISASNDKTIKIWDAITGKELKKMIGYTGRINSACFSPDGRIVITGDDDNYIRIWNVNTGQQIGEEYEDCISRLSSISFSPDGKYIVTTSRSNTIKIWDAFSFKLVSQLFDDTSQILSASFSSDCKHILLISDKGYISVWDFPPLQQLINDTRKRFKNRKLTSEERRQYYLE